jgi:hypothetical protein
MIQTNLNNGLVWCTTQGFCKTGTTTEQPPMFDFTKPLTAFDVNTFIKYFEAKGEIKDCSTCIDFVKKSPLKLVAQNVIQGNKWCEINKGCVPVNTNLPPKPPTVSTTSDSGAAQGGLDDSLLTSQLTDLDSKKKDYTTYYTYGVIGLVVLIGSYILLKK